MDFSLKGFLAITIGSCAGLSAVPQPSQSLLPFVISTSSCPEPQPSLVNAFPIPDVFVPIYSLSASSNDLNGKSKVSQIKLNCSLVGRLFPNSQFDTQPVSPPDLLGNNSAIFDWGILFSSLHSFNQSPNQPILSPPLLSIALPMLCDLGKPEPYTHIIWSLISNPASSIATPIL